MTDKMTDKMSGRLTVNGSAIGTKVQCIHSSLIQLLPPPRPREKKKNRTRVVVNLSLLTR